MHLSLLVKMSPPEELCRQQGFRFVPMVFEAHGGSWGVSARAVIDVISKSLALTTGDAPESSSLQIAQRLSLALHRENARAILKRPRGTSQLLVPDAVPGSMPTW